MAETPDWFEHITGFREGPYAQTRARLAVEGDELVSHVNGSRHATGRLEVVQLAALRQRVALPAPDGPRHRVHCVAADARRLHAEAANTGALFQVASQFNLLEMVGPEVTPEDGVTRYIHDRTQGPACAIAAGAGTIYRNYFASVGGSVGGSGGGSGGGAGEQTGQTAQRQIDALAPLGAALAAALGRPLNTLWTMKNGYALCTGSGLAAITALLNSATEAKRDRLRGELAIGLHHDVEVTDVPKLQRPRVSQAYCSALPVAYGNLPPAAWEAFARLVLEAAYEATLLAAIENQRRGASQRVLLTRLGGGAFGNDEAWIDDAIARALWMHAHSGLEVLLVSYGAVPASLYALARRCA